MKLCQDAVNRANRLAKAFYYIADHGGFRDRGYSANRCTMATSTVLSILVLASIALLGGAFALWRRGGLRRQVTLMVVLALVAIANVAIWTIPDKHGNAPVDEIGSQ